MDHPLNSNKSLTTVMITEGTMLKWEEKLRKDPRVTNVHLLTDDELILWHKYSFKEPYLNILRSDVQRTRVKDRSGFDNYNEILEMLLMFYCEMHIISYHQGMNEIMGPLVLFHHMFNIPLYRIYNLFSCFTQMFLTNYYSGKELSALRSSIQLINLLLKYHEPELYLLFKRSFITPQMYATNWLLTTFANKNKIEVLLTFWDFLIEESDELMMHYIIIAFLRYHKKEFFSAEEAHIPELFSSTYITNCNELISMFNSAKKIKESTPMSFSILVNQMEIFKPNSQMHQELSDKYSIESMLSLPLFPSEVLYANFKNILSCPDHKCRNFKNKYLIKEADSNKKFNLDESNNHLCYCCRNASYPSLNYCIIDIRIFKAKDDYRTEGILPLTKIINHCNIEKEGFIEELKKELVQLKRYTHFIIITTNGLDEYNNKDEEEDDCDEELNHRSHANENESVSVRARAIIEEETNGSNDKDKESHVNEIKAMNQLMDLLIKDQFPYVSYAYGGFKAIHELSFKLSIPLSFHQSIKCSLCLSNKELQEFNKEEVILYQKKATAIDNISSNQLKQKGIIEAKMDKVISIEMFKELSKNDLFKVYHCILLRLNYNQYTRDEKSIILFDAHKVFLLKMRINSETKLELPIIEIIGIKQIIKIKRKNTKVTIIYLAPSNDSTTQHKERMMKVCLFTNGDSVNFSNEINVLLLKK